jgi:hypothetical protein
MFIATPIKNQCKLRRSETRPCTLRSSGANENLISQVSINISSLRDLCRRKTCKNKILQTCYTENSLSQKVKNK